MSNIIWDFETESLSLGLSRPWQLAFIVGEKGWVKKEYNLYIDIHDLNVSAKAAMVTKFNWDYYNSKKISANDVIDTFEPYLLNEENKLIGHNILGFDIYQLKNLYEYVGRELDFKKIIYRFYDTLAIARAQHFQSPAPKTGREFLSWQYRHLHKYDRAFKGSLGALAKKNDIQVDESKQHDALYDVKLNYEVFKKLEYSMELQ